MAISSVNSKKKLEKQTISSSSTSSPNQSLNNSNSSLNNSNSQLRKGNSAISSSFTRNNNQMNSQSPLRTSKTLTKNNTLSCLKTVFKNGLLNENSSAAATVKSDNNEKINSFSNSNNNIKDDNNLNNQSSSSKDISSSNNNNNNIDYGNQYPPDKSVAEINGGLFSVEELNDVLSIFTPALNMIKNKVYHTEVQKNNKIFYKFTHCLEIISFLILTLITSKDNTDKLRYLMYYKIIENLVTIIALNIKQGIYKDIHLYFINKQYILINNKTSIIKQYYYIFRLIEMINERFPNLRVIYNCFYFYLK